MGGSLTAHSHLHIFYRVPLLSGIPRDFARPSTLRANQMGSGMNCSSYPQSGARCLERARRRVEQRGRKKSIRQQWQAKSSSSRRTHERRTRGSRGKAL